MWNAERLHEIAVAISDEARAKHHEFLRQGDHGMYKGLTFWSPNINIFRDPRWGRGHETYGECPYLTARLGVAFCRGLQGDDPNYLKVVATPKHYAVHSGPEGLRHSFDAVVSEKDLRETYLPAFEACITEAKAESIMAAYNRTNGEPCSGSPTLLGKILRERVGLRRLRGQRLLGDQGLPRAPQGDRDLGAVGGAGGQGGLRPQLRLHLRAHPVGGHAGAAARGRHRRLRQAPVPGAHAPGHVRPAGARAVGRDPVRARTTAPSTTRWRARRRANRSCC